MPVCSGSLLTRSEGIDVGVAEMIIDGRVKVRNGVEIDHFTPSSVMFTDGSELQVDAVIFAYVAPPTLSPFRSPIL